MSHRNAPLTELGRLRLARRVVEDGWSIRRAAERFQVAPTTAQRWARRYREHGPAGMVDRSSRPHCSPNAHRPAPNDASSKSASYAAGDQPESPTYSV